MPSKGPPVRSLLASERLPAGGYFYFGVGFVIGALASTQSRLCRVANHGVPGAESKIRTLAFGPAWATGYRPATCRSNA